MKRNYDIYYIYCIYNKVTGKSYIGQRKCPKNKIPETDTAYMGSGILLKKAKKKYGIENFVKYIKESCMTREEANFLEKRWIKFYRTGGFAEYNIADGGIYGGVLNAENPELVKQKLSERTKGRKWFTDGNVNKFCYECPEGFEPGRCGTENWNRYHSVGAKNPFYGKHHSADQRAKWSKERKTNQIYLEALKKGREKQGDIHGKNNPNYGNKWTDEQRQKMSQQRKETICITNGIENKHQNRLLPIPDGWWRGRTDRKKEE